MHELSRSQQRGRGLPPYRQVSLRRATAAKYCYLPGDAPITIELVTERFVERLQGIRNNRIDVEKRVCCSLTLVIERRK